jgi:ATP-binding cassette subfamily B protein
MSSTAERPRAKSLSPLRALLPFLKPYRGMAAAAIGALLVATAAMLALPLALRRVIDVLAAKDAGTTNRMFIGLMVAAVIFGVSAALRFYFVTRLGERVDAD